MPDCVPYPALEGSVTHVPRRSVVALVSEAIGTPRERGRQCERGGWAAAPWSGERPPIGVGLGVSAFHCVGAGGETSRDPDQAHEQSASR
jgi:hypothetical protein